MNVEINGKVLVVNGQAIAEFEFLDQMQVQKTISAGGSVILLFDNRTAFLNDSRRNRNIAEFDSGGRLVWRIQECPHATSMLVRNYWNIRIEDDGRLIAGNTIGVEYVVDRGTGEVTPLEGQGRPW